MEHQTAREVPFGEVLLNMELQQVAQLMALDKEIYRLRERQDQAKVDVNFNMWDQADREVAEVVARRTSLLEQMPLRAASLSTVCAHHLSLC